MARRQSAQIQTQGEEILILGPLGLNDLPRLLAALHRQVEREHRNVVRLNFEGCTAAFPGPMVALCAQVARLRADGVETEIRLPSKPDLAKLFRNTNWAHITDPTRQSPSNFRGYTHVPVTQFTSPTEQGAAVNKILDAVLSSMTGFVRSDLAAIERALNEITDNVLTHARCPTGGFVQLSALKTKQRIEYVVCDAGIGIPKSLRETHSDITSDAHALERAIREGITRDKTVGQGNGLFGSFQVSRISEGYFHIHSGYGKLDYDRRSGLDISKGRYHSGVPCLSLASTAPDRGFSRKRCGSTE
jgi:anti-sigma regulatory factor (Ser/Thr protein kinase)